MRLHRCSRLIRAGGIVGQRIARQDRCNERIYRDRQGVTAGFVSAIVGISDCIADVTGANTTRISGLPVCRGQGHHLRGAQHLAKSLVLGDIEGALAAIVEMGDVDRAAVGETKLIAAKGRNAAGIGDGGVVKVVARIEGGVAHKLENRSMETAGAGAW